MNGARADSAWKYRVMERIYEMLIKLNDLIVLAAYAMYLCICGRYMRTYTAWEKIILQIDKTFITLDLCDRAQ